MSIINVVEHNETIYNIVHNYDTSINEEKTIKSDDRKRIKKNAKTKIYNQKNVENIQPVEGANKHKGCLADASLPPLPKYSPPEQKDKPCINFKIKNIKSAMHRVSKPIDKKLVDTHNGHTYKDDCLRMVNVFDKKYGNLPKYLVKHRDEMGKNFKEYQDYLDNKETLCTPISTEERQELLDGLMKNWSELQKQFLLLPILTDTTPKVIKKKKLEDQLNKLEKDIEMVKSHPFIYIYE